MTEPTAAVSVEDLVPQVHGDDPRLAVSRVAIAEPEPLTLDRARWIADGGDGVDIHAGLRGHLRLDRATRVEVRVLGASAYRLWLDGEPLGWGPPRFAPSGPEYHTYTLNLAAGSHVLAAHVHSDGVPTRVLTDLAPFLACALVADDGEELAVRWVGRRLPGHVQTRRRISPILGWMPWCVTGVDGAWWRPEADDAEWPEATVVDTGLPPARRCELAELRERPLELTAAAGGVYAERHTGYPLDDPAFQFAAADLDAGRPGAAVPPDGPWHRYDLDRQRSGTLAITVTAPAGTIVTAGVAEELCDGRVFPSVPNSGGPTCLLARWTTAGGTETLTTLDGMGLGHLEVRAAHPEATIDRVVLADRDLLGDPAGAFACGDAQLERIWQVGIDTLRACTDDAVTDCPTRERGEWVGDAAGIGLEIAGVAYHDLAVLRRTLVHAAECADARGLVGGLVPGEVIYLGTYAARWLSAVWRLYELTADRTLLEQLLDSAVANLRCLAERTDADGTVRDIPWMFVDWGYAVPENAPDLVVLLLNLAAARDLRRWADAVGPRGAEAAAVADAYAARLGALVAGMLPAGDDGWDDVSFHGAVLGLRLLGLDAAAREAAVRRVLAHLGTCFPNAVDAPRLRDPAVRETRLITPSFGHETLAALLENGHGDEAIAQWRRCWGWMLDHGATTWWEVFDPRWSRCHAWSGAPTWQMSRYLLGLHPRGDLGVNTYELAVSPTALPGVSGRLPTMDGGVIDVSWRAEPDGALAWTAAASVPVTVLLPDGESLAVGEAGGSVRVSARSR